MRRQLFNYLRANKLKIFLYDFSESVDKRFETLFKMFRRKNDSQIYLDNIFQCSLRNIILRIYSKIRLNYVCR